MQLILASTAHCDTQGPEAIVAALGAQRVGETELGQAATRPQDPERILARLPTQALIRVEDIGGLDSVADWLKATDTIHLLAFHTPPEAALARAIGQQEQSLTEAAEHWAESARELLHTIRHHRRQVLLFDASAAAANAGAFRSKLQETTGLKGGWAEPSEDPGKAERQTDIHNVLAAQFVAQSPELQDLRDELEARAIPLGDHSESHAPDCENALAALRQRQQEWHELADEKQQLTEENELLLLQLHQVQEELESYYLENQENKKEKDKAAERKGELEKEADFLKREVERLRAERDWAKHHMEKMKNSTSWKLTAPIRAVRGRNRSAASKEA